MYILRDARSGADWTVGKSVIYRIKIIKKKKKRKKKEKKMKKKMKKKKEKERKKSIEEKTLKKK